MWIQVLLFFFVFRGLVFPLAPMFFSNLMEPIYSLVLLLSGVGYGLNYYYARRRKETSFLTVLEQNAVLSRLVAELRALGESFFSFFLPMFLFFSFGCTLQQVISGSLKPTVLVDDIILCEKYRYGFRMPLTSKVLVPTSSPKRGDIVCFRFKENGSSTSMVKRMIGLPGDHIQYKNKHLTINGKPCQQRTLGIVTDPENNQAFLAKEEDLANRRHHIYISLDKPLVPLEADEEFSVTVPEKQYFVMGDNRDNSLDSRMWGFLPDDYLVGEARYVLFSWDKTAPWTKPLRWIRWERLGRRLH